MECEAGRASRRRSWPYSSLLGAFVSVCLAGIALSGPATAAKLVSAKSSEQSGFGRIVLSFDTAVGVKARVGGAILVLTFSEPVAAGPERIASGLPGYVGAVRRDPDGTALRLALQRPYRVSVQEAAEQVFVDLLPENWPGLAPPLPPEIVTELARRARAAEAALKERTPPPAPKSVALELSHGPGRTRLSLRLPTEARPKIGEADGRTTVTLPGAWRIDGQTARGRLAPETGQFEVENDGAGARLIAIPAHGVRLAAEHADETVTVDFLTGAATPPANVKLDETPAQPHAPEPVAERPAPTVNAPPVDVVDAAKPQRAGTGLVFPFKQMPPVALFERAGATWLVFETPEPVAIAQAREPGLSVRGEIRRVGGFALMRVTMPQDRFAELVPVSEPQGWELMAREDPLPSAPLPIDRTNDAKGKAALAVKLPEPRGSVWLDLDGERVAVVTTASVARTGLPKPQRYVDFELLRSRFGLAVLGLSDALTVRAEPEEVRIASETGLVVSEGIRSEEAPVDPADALAIDRKAWETAQLGDVRASLRQDLEAVIGADAPERTPKRLALVRAMIANGLDVEALGALDAAARDDPMVDVDPQTTILRGLIAARMGRVADAETQLSAPAVARSPEARLWRGFARASVGRWKDADEDLRAGQSVLGRYPRDLATAMSLASAESAAELGDWGTVAQVIRDAGDAGTPARHQRFALLKARLGEAHGGNEAALAAYRSLAESQDQPVATAAALRAVQLALVTQSIEAPAAIDALERVLLSWHGGPVEAEALAALGRLYEQAGRWRDVFNTVRRAEALAPDAASTRTLHESAAALFESLYLGERAERVGGVEALALYFDFKEFAPAGRSADEIVRRLADRLVALDLLDSAEDLLEHQIQHRLNGAARAGVAARLATIHLMDSKPLEALRTLDDTHLPELPEDVRRARSLLRARALSDLTRTDLALETLEDETGRDVERMRADILWSARRWRETGEAHEALVSAVWRERGMLDDNARADLIRAAIAYGYAGESIGLERLKAKFAPAMAESAQARTFAMLTRPDAARTTAFRDIARRQTTAQTLAAFMEEYRQRYPQMSVPMPGSAAEPVQTAATPG